MCNRPPTVCKRIPMRSSISEPIFVDAASLPGLPGGSRARHLGFMDVFGRSARARNDPIVAPFCRVNTNSDCGCSFLITVNIFESSEVIGSRPVSSPDAPVALRVPKICEQCHTLGCVDLQHTVHGDRVQLQWRCATCEAEWPVKHRDQHVATTQCPFCGSNRGFNYASDHGVHRYRCSKCNHYWAASASTQ